MQKSENPKIMPGASHPIILELFSWNWEPIGILGAAVQAYCIMYIIF